jgi:hypothetical protein
MTTAFRSEAICPSCGTAVPLETPFSRWIRNCKEYDSRNGYVLMDKDLIVHKYMTNHNREIPYIMCVEVKSKGAEMSATQRDTFHTFAQLIRNRQNTPTSKRPLQSGPYVTKIYSTMNKRYYNIRSFGGHVLTLSNTTPDNSLQIQWDRTIIDKAILIKLLRFEINPDSLGPIDNRIHHVETPNLFEGLNA